MNHSRETDKLCIQLKMLYSLEMRHVTQKHVM